MKIILILKRKPDKITTLFFILENNWENPRYEILDFENYTLKIFL